MSNFGFNRLILSDPVTYAFHAAEKLAVGSEHLLETLSVSKTLSDALRDMVYACGTTSRRPVRGRLALHPEQAAVKLAAQARRGPVGLVFGGEKRGLSDDELALCQDIAVIPTAPAQPSMNVSHAAAVLLYLCAKGKRTGARSKSPLPGARLGTIGALEQAMRSVLLKSAFLNPQAPDRALRELTRSLVRSRLTQREAEMWLTAFRHIMRSLEV